MLSVKLNENYTLLSYETETREMSLEDYERFSAFIMASDKCIPNNFGMTVIEPFSSDKWYWVKMSIKAQVNLFMSPKPDGYIGTDKVKDVIIEFPLPVPAFVSKKDILKSLYFFNDFFYHYNSFNKKFGPEATDKKFGFDYWYCGGKTGFTGNELLDSIIETVTMCEIEGMK